MDQYRLEQVVGSWQCVLDRQHLVLDVLILDCAAPDIRDTVHPEMDQTITILQFGVWTNLQHRVRVRLPRYLIHQLPQGDGAKRNGRTLRHLVCACLDVYVGHSLPNHGHQLDNMGKGTFALYRTFADLGSTWFA